MAALNGSNYRGPVWHCAVRAAHEDRLLSDAEWAQVATAIMDRTGLAPVGDDLAVRWVAVRHAPDHIHLVATLARQDQIRPKVWNDYFRVREACQDAERQFGLRCTAPADRTAARRATRAESEQAIWRGWDEPPAPASAAKSALPPPERARSKSSSPAWPRLECWSAAGTARSARVR